MNPYLWILERHVDGETRPEAREGLEVGGVGQRAAALGEHGEGQRFEVLAVDVALPAVHRLQQVLAGDDLTRAETTAVVQRACSERTSREFGERVQTILVFSQPRSRCNMRFGRYTVLFFRFSF